MEVVVMCGNVGSGKSSFIQEHLNNYVRISQDVLGSKPECIRVMREALEAGKDVVVDRVNFNVRQRATWIYLAKEYKATVHAICLVVPKETCYNRIVSRKGHETIKEDMTEEKKRSIVESFAGIFKNPDLREGFKSVSFVDNS